MRAVIAGLLIFISAYCGAQFNNLRDNHFFKRFNTKDGLSQASVNCILHDSKGFMWFGTDDGLNRFDGNQFKIFRNNPDDSTSIFGNAVRSIIEDEHGNIWVGTEEGLNLFDRHLEKFRVFKLSNKIYYDCPDLKIDIEKKRLWVAAAQEGVAFLDLETKTLRPLTVDKFQHFNVSRVEKIKNTLYVGTVENGLFSINLTTNNIEEIRLPFVKADKQYAIRVLKSQANILWVGTEGGGLTQLNTETGDAATYSTL